MAVTTEHFYSGNNSTTSFAYTFPYYKTSDIKVYVGGTLKTESTHYDVDGTNIKFKGGHIPPIGTNNIHIYRDTDVDTSKATFAAGSSIRAIDLNNNNLQLLYHAQEQDNTIQTGNVAAAEGKGQLVNNNISATAAIAGTKIAPNFGSQNIATTGTLESGATTITGNIAVTGTVDGRDVAADGIKLDGIEQNATADQTNAEIRAAVEAANDSNVFTDADHSKLNAIEAGATANQSDSEIRAAVAAASDSNIFTDADHSKLDAIEANATADQTNAEIRAAVEAASDSNVFTDADHSKLNAIEANATADQTASEIKSLIASSPLDASHLAVNSVTTSEIADAELTTLAGMQSGTASILAGGTALTADLTELNLLDGKSIVTQIAANATDVQIPTAQAVDERITTVLSNVGGFVPITNETSFPVTNPDPGGNAGTIVSVKALASGFTLGSGVTTKVFTNGAGSGKNVTITGLTQSTTYPAGRGMLLETTQYSGGGRGGDADEYEYAFHRLTLDETGVASAQAAIDDYDERYYGPLSSAPSTKPGGGARANGDMYFDTSANKMKVFNATTSAWDDVATSASSFISTLSPAFDGSETEFTASNVPVDAQSAIISINGVIQKPNSGTSTPSEGYVQLANDKIKFATAPASGSDYFMITLGNAVSIGTPSNNTVSTSIIQNGAVTTDKIADDAVTADKLANSINTEIAANTAKTTNATHSGEVTGATALTIADNVVDEANLKVSNSPTNGQFLSAQSGNTGGLTWAAVPAGVGGATGVDFNDNVKARFGTGNDLSIYHNGSHSYIEDGGTGRLIAKTSYFEVDNAAGNEAIIEGIEDGAVNLYYDGSKKLATHTSGIQLDNTGGTSGKGTALFGNSGMPYIQGLDSGNHGSSSGIFLYSGSGDSFIKCKHDGAVELYYDNSKKLATESAGVAIWNGNIRIPNDTYKMTFGAGADLQIYHDGTDNIILSNGASCDLLTYVANGELAVKAVANGAVELYYDNAKKFETNAAGILVTGNITTGDNNEVACGANGDLKLYHDGTASYIKNTLATGDLILDSAQNFYIKHSGEVQLQCVNDGAVNLYYDGSKKFETYSSGTLTTGNCKATGDFRIENDTGKIELGASGDLQIYHDGSNSYLVNTTGFLKIKDESNVRIDTDAFAVNKGDNSETMIVATADAGVDLYYDNTKTFSTQTNGIAAYGSEGNDAYVYIFADEADDHADQWRIRGWQASQTLTIEYRNSGGSYENSIVCNGDGNVKLCYNNTEVVETHSAGLLINQHYALYMVAGNWTGDTTGKIQAHADHLYFQNCNNTGKWVFRLPSGTEPAQIDHNGTFGSSDERLKKDITTITNAVSIVKQLTGRSFTWKESDQKSFGVIAQEIEPVLPDLITTQTVPEGTTDPDPYKMVNYAALSGHFIEAIKELSAKIETLETKVAALEAK